MGIQKSMRASPSLIGLKFMRFHNPGWCDCDSLESAIAQAFWMIEDNHAAPLEVVTLDGKILLDNKSLKTAVDEYRKKYDNNISLHLLPPSKIIPSSDQVAALAFSVFMGFSDIQAANWQVLPECVKTVWRDNTKFTEN